MGSELMRQKVKKVSVKVMLQSTKQLTKQSTNSQQTLENPYPLKRSYKRYYTS